MLSHYTVKSLFLLSICILFISCDGTKEESKRPLPDFQVLKPFVLQQEGPEIHQYWEFSDEAGLWETDFQIPGAIQTFRDSLLGAIGPDSLEFMLKRERSVTAKSDLPLDSLDNWQIVHQGYAGRIRDINYLEAQILNYQISRFPLLSHPTEFHGFILNNEEADLIRVYISASDAPFPPKPYAVTDQVDSLTQKDWELIYHLHNHYREPEENYLGAMGPSMADAHYFKNLHKRVGLGHALVTNGYTTCVIKAEELPTFNSH